jgi:hypothetical protein
MSQILYSFADKLALREIEGFSIDSLAAILANSSLFYRSFEIPKRRGGFRKVSAPYPLLGAIQKSLHKVLLPLTEVSPEAFAYITGRNAIQHAQRHLGHAELLTLDIKDFFPSIKRQRVHQVLLDAGADADFAHIASLLVTLQGALPQGAATSPLLSNLVFVKSDHRLRSLAASLGLVYTRYADDLAFSGSHIPRNLPKTISQILREGGFELDDRKTTLKLSSARKIITGVSISSGKLKAPRSFVRMLRSEIHRLESREIPMRDPLAFERVLGRLNYWLQVEPENAYATLKKSVLSTLHQEFLALSADFSVENLWEKAA